MIRKEPHIQVALLQNYPHAGLLLNGDYLLPDGRGLSGHHFISVRHDAVVLADRARREILRSEEILLSAVKLSSFTLSDVKIGIDFHWQRNQDLSFCGNIILRVQPDSSFHLINEIPLEDYLASVIASEMSAEAPLEFLKAQAVVARSWLMAMLERKKMNSGKTAIRGENEIIVWQDVNDHEGFDVCADDHCQRYQGISRIISPNVRRAMDETRGMFLCFGEKICDARYHKCCGGQTDVFASAWEDQQHGYLSNISDAEDVYLPVHSEQEARRWLTEKPKAYCNTADEKLLSRILPDFDRETVDFYRWRVAYRREELEGIIREKSGLEVGKLKALVPLARGPSGRICKLKIVGSKQTVTIGKELEIRRCLSPSHLLSSAFVVDEIRAADGSIEQFTFYGGGWGHGVGLCQIGAAVMASMGFKTEEILAHYFRGAQFRKLY